MLLDDYQALLRRVEQASRKQAEAEGAYRELLKRLESEFGCKTIEEAEKLAEELDRQFRKLVKLYMPQKAEAEKALDKLEDK